MADTTPIFDVTDATFERDVLQASRRRPVVVDFWAAWCAPCRALSPIIEAAVTDHGGVSLAKLDTDANPAAAQAFRIQGIPAVKGFVNGAVAAEFVGLQQRPAVDQFLARLAPPSAATAELPTDEAGLRTVLADHPDNVDARRALGQLLVDAARFADAEAVLADAPHDPVCDGLRARMELRTTLPEIDRVGSGDVHALPGLIATLASQSDDNRALLRRVIVGIIESARAKHPEVEQYRAQLASALF